MKKFLSVILVILISCNSLIFVYAETDNLSGIFGNSAMQLAQIINSIAPDSCTVEGNTLIFAVEEFYLEDTLIIPSGDEIVLNLNDVSIFAVDGKDAIYVSEGAILTVTGGGAIFGGDGFDDSTYSDGGNGIYNAGVLRIIDAEVNGGDSYRRSYFGNGGSGVFNEGTLYIEDGNIDGGVGRSSYADESLSESEFLVNGGHGVTNTGTADLTGGWIKGGRGDSAGGYGIKNIGILTITGECDVQGGNPRLENGKGGCGILVGSGSDVEINGGTISGASWCENPGNGIVSESNLCINAGLIEGGTINDEAIFAKAIEGTYSIGSRTILNESNDGYNYTTVDGTSSDCRYVLAEVITGAMILAEQINNMQPDSCYYDGDTVYLKSDITITKTIQLSNGYEYALNLYLYDIKCADGLNAGIYVQDGAELTLRNGSVYGAKGDETEQSIFAGSGGDAIQNYGRLIVDDCYVCGGEGVGEGSYGGKGIFNYTTGELTITDSKICGGTGVWRNEVAINGTFDTDTAYAQESDDGEIYTKVNGNTSDKQYIKFVERNSVTELVDIINSYEDDVCMIENNNCIKLLRPLEINEQIVIPEGDDIVLDTTNLKCSGIYIPAGASLRLCGNGEVIGKNSSGENHVADNAITNLGNLIIDGGIYKGGDNSSTGGYAGNGIKNSGNLIVYGGKIYGGNTDASDSIAGRAIIDYGASTTLNGGIFQGGTSSNKDVIPSEGIIMGGGDLTLNNCEIIGGTGVGCNAAAISGNISGGLAIKESDDGIDYTLITSSNSNKQYILAESGSGCEVVATNINIHQANSCVIQVDQDTEEEKVVLTADIDEPIGICGSYPTIIDMNSHSMDEVAVSGDGYYIEGDGKIKKLIAMAHNVTISGNLCVDDYIENGHGNQFIIESTAELDALIINYGEVITGGTIIGGIKNKRSGFVIVDGGGIFGDARNEGIAICCDEIDSGIVINKGIVKASDNIKNASAISLMLYEGEDDPRFIIEGGAVIGGSNSEGGGYAVSAKIQKMSSGAGGGSNSTIETVFVSMNGGILIGGEEKPALTGCIAYGEGVSLFESEDGEHYTNIDNNKTDLRYLKAESINYIPVTSISLNHSSYVTTIGKNIQLSAIFNPSDATNQEVVWASSDSNIVTVNKGFVNVVGIGNATVTATTIDGNKQAVCHITVVKESSGGGSVGGYPSTLGNIFTHNITYNGKTWSCDLTLFIQGTICGNVLVSVYEGEKLIDTKSYVATEEIPVSVDCTKGQKIKLFWWDENLSPKSLPAEIEV